MIDRNWIINGLFLVPHLREEEGTAWWKYKCGHEEWNAATVAARYRPIDFFRGEGVEGVGGKTDVLGACESIKREGRVNQFVQYK